MRNVRNWFTYKPQEVDIEAIQQRKQPNQVVPGQSMSAKEILEKYRRGMPLPPPKEGQYFGDLDVPDFDTMDLTEIDQWKKDFEETLQAAKDNVKKEEEQKATDQKESFTKAVQDALPKPEQSTVESS